MTIKNPTFGFRLVGGGNEAAVFEVFGETGERTELLFEDEDHLLDVAAGLKKVSEMLFYAKEFGIEDAAEKYGLEFDTPENNQSTDLWNNFNDGGSTS